MTTAHEHVDTIVIGAGQTGLATAYHLAKAGQSFVALDQNERVGDGWRARYDSLRLYSPAKYDGLPGKRFPAPGHTFPSGRQMADYLEDYAQRFALPVRGGVAVDSLRRNDSDDGWVVTAGSQTFEARNVVVATGAQRLPKRPDFATELHPRITQLHSSEYRTPQQLADGAVLVVGAAHSGADLALEAARDHETTLVGPHRGEIPFDIEGRPARVFTRVMWFVANHVLTLRTPIGRKMQKKVRDNGGPLLRVKRADLADAGVHRTEARVVGVEGGRPVLADGTVLDVATVIWCTGFRRDWDWIAPRITGADGWPAQERGVSTVAPDLYFVGVTFQYSFASMLVGGAGRDAQYVARQIVRSARSAAPVPAVA